MELINGKPDLICVIADKQGMGKSTLAGHLECEYGYSRVSIATPLKRGMAEMFKGLLGRRAFTYFFENKDEPIPELGNVTARQLLVGCGQGTCAAYQEAFLAVALNQARFQIKAGVPVVVDDVRKPYEFDAFNADGAFFIRVDRPANTAEPAEIEGLISEKPAYKMLIDSEPGNHDLMYHLTADLMTKGLWNE